MGMLFSRYCVGALFCFFLFHPNLSSGHDLTRNQINELIQKFAPLVKLHTNEPYFPSSVQWYLDRSVLKNNQLSSARGGSIEADEVVAVRPSSSFLTWYDEKDPTVYLTPLGDENERAVTFRGMQPETSGGLIPAPCYANLVETSDELIIQYMFFYPYNGRQWAGMDTLYRWTGINIGAHEGDWEHMGVHLQFDRTLKDQSPSAINYKINRLYYSRHTSKFGIYVQPNEAEFVEGTHPVVYSAFNGHASYPHPIIGISYMGDRTSSDGPQWRCWENVEYVGDLSNPEPNQEWIQFGGLWGGLGKGEATAPATPTFQDWWESQ